MCNRVAIEGYYDKLVHFKQSIYLILNVMFIFSLNFYVDVEHVKIKSLIFSH